MKLNMKASVTAVMVGLLFCSVTLNVYLFRTARHFFSLFQSTRFNPLNLDEFPVAETQNETGKVRVMFFGDSRAAFWPAPVISDAFIFMNRGIAGHTSTQTQLRFAHHVLPAEPDVLIVQVCVNDLTTLPLWPKQYESIIETCQNNLQQMVADAKAQGIKVILTTVFPMGRIRLGDRPYYSPLISQGIEEINDFIRSMEGEGVVVWDTVPILVGGDGWVQNEYAEDWLHLSPAGYAALNAELADLLISLYP